jgi:predicted permease
VAVALATGVVFSVAPIWLTRGIRADELHTAGRSQDPRNGHVAKLLVAAQVALSVTVVVAAALFATTVRNLRGQDMGFSAEGVVTFSLDADGTGMEGERLTALHRRILDRLRAIPGAQSATLASVSPLSSQEDGKAITIPGFVSPTAGDVIANVNTVGPGYFDTFGIPILRGRGIVADDAERTPHVALISQSAADYYFAGRDPIGSRVAIRGRTTLTPEIIGVVPDVMYDDLRTDAERMFYVPFFQRVAEGEYVFAVRTSGAVATLLRDIPAVINDVAPDMPVLGLTTMAGHIDARAGNERLLAIVATVSGGLALILAGIGISGIVAYTVTRRTPELGLRMALGASARHVLWLVGRGSVLVVAVGLVIGVSIAVASSRLLSNLLFGVPPDDPRIYATAAGFLFLVGVVASLPPVVRALRIRPIVLLRHE